MLPQSVLFAVLGIAVISPALAETHFYGQLQLNIVSLDPDDASYQAIRDEGSFFGIRGLQTLKPDLYATYIVEAGAHREDKADLLGETRQAWVGLRGRLGEIRAGRQFSPTRVSSERIDLFSGQQGDYNTILETDLIYPASLTYINRTGALDFALTFARKDDDDHADMVASYSSGDYFAALGLLKQQHGFSVKRLSAGYQPATGHRLGIAMEQKSGADGYDAVLVNAGYHHDKTLYKLQAGRNHAHTGGRNEDMYAIGVDYDLGRKAQLHLEHSRNDHRDHSRNDRQSSYSIGWSWHF
ncbi:MAG: porin [Thiothrix sp.]|nr:porin [Thiothrix sp.]HPE61901.1 porin [Thiolinea sp.]